MTALVVAGAAATMGSVRIVCRFDGGATDPALAHVDDCIARFCLLGRAGGLRPDSREDGADFRVVSGARRRGDAEVEALLAVGALQDGAPQLLRGMLEGGTVPGAVPAILFFGAVGTAFEDGVDIAIPGEDDEESAYPAPIAGLPFRVEFVDRSYRKTRRVLVEFETPAADDALPAVQRAAAAWAGVLAAGGFAAPVFEPGESDSTLGDVQVFDPWTVEIEVWIFEASDAAWPTLLNALAAATAPVAPVRRVVIE